MNPDLDLVRRIRPGVADRLRRTPLVRSDWLSERTGAEVFLKCEGLQVTGSFKVRGGVAALSLMEPGDRAGGVAAASAGNHGLGLAWAARAFDVPCSIVVPRDAPAVKVEGIRELGARVERSPYPGYDDTLAWTEERLAGGGAALISAFEDPAVIAGNGGTLMLEILEDAPDLDAVVIPCGGGGCSVGAGIVAKSMETGVRVFGVNTEASPGMWLSRRDGRAHLRVRSKPTIAEGIEGGVGEITFSLGRRFIEDILVVPETGIRRAVVDTLVHERMLLEGSGAAGVAALLDGQVPGRRICVVLTGSNIDPHLLRELLAEAG